jgi:hypothetical protein
MAAIYSNGGNRWNILGFNFTKRDALSSVYKISMRLPCVYNISHWLVRKRVKSSTTSKTEVKFWQQLLLSVAIAE